MGSWANCKVHIRRGHFQLLEENIRHVEVIMLAGMHQGLTDGCLSRGGLANGAGGGKRAQHGRCFHKIRTGAYNMEKVHAVEDEIVSRGCVILTSSIAQRSTSDVVE